MSEQRMEGGDIMPTTPNPQSRKQEKRNTSTDG
jgi:hypothetical protein